MKSKIIFILCVLFLFYVNFIGRTHGLFLNFVVSGITNFLITYYLLKINPFKKMGLFLIFFPFALLTFTVFYGLYNDFMMPGIFDYIIYIIATSFSVLLLKNSNKKTIFLTYLIIFISMIYNYHNLYEYYYHIKEKNININKNFPFDKINLIDINGEKRELFNENKIIVLDFWTLNCANCISSFPKFEKVKKNYNNDNEIVFLSVNVYYKKNELIKSQKLVSIYSFQNLFTDKSIFNVLNFNSVPKYMIIGKDGKIKYFGNLNSQSNQDFNNIYRLIENEK